MPIVTLSDSTFAKLKALAEPFTDTPESVVLALAEAELSRRGIRANGNSMHQPKSPEVLSINPDSHVNLTHTRLLSATVDRQPLHRPKWNELREHLHVQALRRLGSFDALRAASSANLRSGRYEEDGYRYVPNGDFSIQGVDANHAWDHSLGLARRIEVAVEVMVEWRDKEGAALPGKRGVMKWTPADAESPNGRAR